MFTVVITEKGGAQRRMDFDKSEVTIGRVQGNDIILPKGNVSKRHSRIVLKDSRFIVVDLKSTNGTYVNGRKITSPLVVKPGDKIYIGDFIMTVEEGAAAASQPSMPAPNAAPPLPDAPPPQQPPPPMGAPPMGSPPAGQPPLGQPPMAPPQAPPQAPQPAPSFEPPPAPEMQPPPMQADGGRPRLPTQQDPQAAAFGGAGPTSAPPPLPSNAPAEPALPPPGPSGGFGLDREPPEEPPRAPTSRPEPPQPPAVDSAPAPLPREPAPPPKPVAPGMEGALRQVMAHVAQSFDLSDAHPEQMRDQSRWDEARKAVQTAISSLGAAVGSVDQQALVDAAAREAVGLGPLEDLLANEQIREIIVNGPSQVSADLGRGLEPVDGVFSSSDGVVVVGRRLLAQAGAFLQPSKPIHEATLPYGPHVTIILPPVAVRGPIIEVRRMGQTLHLDHLVQKGMLSREMGDCLRSAVSARRNVVVAGPIGSGVTTLLGAAATLAGDGERIVTVETVPDLAIDKEGVVSFGAGKGATSLSLGEVVDRAARMRADRLVVDDVAGVDAFPVFSAVGVRALGNLVGVHTAPGQRAEDGILGMLQLAGGASSESLRSLIAQTAQVVLEVARGEDGVRRVVRMTEVTGANNGSINTTELFSFNGQFSGTGSKPSFT
ncbi:MAG: ATPase, T2SS/T4P/T4SS family [Myxococcota bacterium]